MKDLRVEYGKRDDGSMWLSIGDPGNGTYEQGDWHFGEERAQLFAHALNLQNFYEWMRSKETSAK